MCKAKDVAYKLITIKSFSDLNMSRIIQYSIIQ